MRFLVEHWWLLAAPIALWFWVQLWIRDMLPWTRHELSAGRPRSIWLLTGIAAALAVLTLILPWGSLIQARVALASIGVLLILVVHLRPATLWTAGSTELWRIMFGDRGTVWLCTLIGIAIVAYAWLHRLAP